MGLLAVLVGVTVFYASRSTGPATTSQDQGSKIAVGTGKPPQTPAHVQEGKTGAPVSETLPPGHAPVPRPFQFAGVTNVHTADSFKDWLAQFPEADRKTINAFADKVKFVYAVNSPAQVAWMAEKGYPMPEDVIAASTMSDEDLRELAEHGSVKAGFFNYLRAHEEYSEGEKAFIAGGGSAAQYAQGEGNALYIAKMRSNSLVIANPYSPFSGYLQASDALTYNNADPEAGQLAIVRGIVQASMAGDVRGSDILNAYEKYGLITQGQLGGAIAAMGGATSAFGFLIPRSCYPKDVIPGVY